MLLWVAVAPTNAEIGKLLEAEKLRLLPGCKVAAFVELVVVTQFGMRSLDPTPWGLIELVRKGAHGNRDGELLRGEKA
jgi:hypothetical protein